MTRNDAPRREIIGLIVGHGSLPAALRTAALSIVNTPDALFAISNVSRSAAGLDERLRAAVAEHQENDILLFVDLFGSSCSHASAGIEREHPGISAICGVNLSMLVRFLYYRHRLDYSELVDLMHRTGVEAIRSGRQDDNTDPLSG
jgi:mannose/fructose-specific phosphotransferase system component IIA